MQRSCTRVALAYVDKSNEDAHRDSRYSVEAGLPPASMDGLHCAAGTAAITGLHPRALTAGPSHLSGLPIK